MAQPIPLTLTPKGPDPAERLEDALHRHADAIVSALELLQLLHDRGVLELVRGLVGAGDQLVGIFTAAAGAPESLRGMRNFILLTKFFASIPPEVLDSLPVNGPLWPVIGTYSDYRNMPDALVRLVKSMNLQGSGSH